MPRYVVPWRIRYQKAPTGAELCVSTKRERLGRADAIKTFNRGTGLVASGSSRCRERKTRLKGAKAMSGTLIVVIAVLAILVTYLAFHPDRRQNAQN